MRNEQYYDQFSKHYDAQRLAGYFGFVNEMEAAVLKPLSLNKSVLEIGCGTGLILQQIRKEAESAVGVDLSHGMLLSAAAKGLSVARADAVAMPFKSDSFDVVCSFKVLAHIKNIEKSLNEAARVAKSNGFVVLEFYNSRSIKRLTNFFIRKKIFTRYDSLAAIKRMLPRQLSIEAVKGVRIAAPASFFFSLPVIGKITRAVERSLSKTPLTLFGSYFIVVCRKK